MKRQVAGGARQADADEADIVVAERAPPRRSSSRCGVVPADDDTSRASAAVTTRDCRSQACDVLSADADWYRMSRKSAHRMRFIGSHADRPDIYLGADRRIAHFRYAMLVTV